MKILYDLHLRAGFGAPAEIKTVDISDKPIGEIMNEHKLYGDFINLRYEHDRSPKTS